MAIANLHCETGSRHRQGEADLRRFLDEDRRKAEAWHDRLKRAVAKRLAHETDCTACQTHLRRHRLVQFALSLRWRGVAPETALATVQQRNRELAAPLGAHDVKQLVEWAWTMPFSGERAVATAAQDGMHSTPAKTWGTSPACFRGTCTCPETCDCVALGCDHPGTKQSWAHPKTAAGQRTLAPVDAVRRGPVPQGQHRDLVLEQDLHAAAHLGVPVAADLERMHEHQGAARVAAPVRRGAEGAGAGPVAAVVFDDEAREAFPAGGIVVVQERRPFVPGHDDPEAYAVESGLWDQGGH